MVTFESDGSLTFRVYLPHAESVQLVASFTEWSEGRVALEREEAGRARGRGLTDEHVQSGPNTDTNATPGGRGWWSIRVQAPEGDHAFSYLVDNQWWLPDYAAHGVKRNEHGNWTSLLFVPPPPRLLERLGKRRIFEREGRNESRLEVALRIHRADLGQAV